jgi:antitoxin VapB
MSMNIKNEAAHKLARQLSRLTGESITETVTQSLRERVRRVQNKKSAGLSERLLEIGRDCAPRLKEPYLSADHGDLLYDKKGLPK